MFCFYFRLELEKVISGEGLPYNIVCDAGRTQIASGSLTVIGVGPATSERIAKVTKDLARLD